MALVVTKEPRRDTYLVWVERKAPDFVVEITSKSTRQEDRKTKFEIYRDILKVSGLFLFDRTWDYLDPPLQGFRLSRGKYVPIKPITGRIPSRVLGLHLERDGTKRPVFNPATGERLPTRLEAREAAEHSAKEHLRRAEAAEAALRHLAEENDRLRREIEAKRRG